MFYNTYRATRSTLQNRQYSTKPKTIIDPIKHILNQPKRQKLKHLLMTKFIQKYNIKNPNEFLDLIVTQFIQGEKLNDIDLKRLDLKIKRLNKEFNAKNELKTDLENLYPVQTEVNNLSEINLNKNENSNNNSNNNIIYNFSEGNTLNKGNNNRNKANEIRNLKSKFPTLNNYLSKTENNVPIKRGCNSYNKIPIKSPEEELAELEKEFREDELAEKKKSKYKRIDFSNQGDEWTAIVNYNKNLYQRQLIEEKMKDLEIKKRTKECLDFQVKEKLKRELEEKLKDKEFNEKIKQHSKILEDLHQKKLESISEQIKRLKKDRDFILKNHNLKKKIEELKDKKFENTLVKRYKEEIEQDKKEELEKKKQGKKDLISIKKIIEEKEKLLKERIQQEKEEDRKTNQLKNILDQRKENERNLYYRRIKSLSNKYLLPNSEKILKKLAKDKKDEEEKIQYFYDEKNKKEYEKEEKAKLKRNNDKKEIKKMLDMQIEQKKNEEKFLKLLDKEQARIWKIDEMKRNDEMKLEQEHIKKMNKKNFECLLKQIEQNKKNKSKKNIMSENEYALNRDLLEKANEDYLKTYNK